MSHGLYIKIHSTQVFIICIVLEWILQGNIGLHDQNLCFKKSSLSSSAFKHAIRVVPTCRKLLALNPDNHTYHKGLRQVLGLLPSSTGAWSDQQQQELEQLYEKLCKEFPKSTTSRRMQLDFLVIAQLSPGFLFANCKGDPGLELLFCCSFVSWVSMHHDEQA